MHPSIFKKIIGIPIKAILIKIKKGEEKSVTF
jgi:hypothetical protein